ncbi:prohibitin family protein [Croceimicrobium sp.]|uniref:prohibitin family protein n=1 Tax=Croceimicrobium sp. TaxID=2828340 RepID=UPI003BA89338
MKQRTTFLIVLAFVAFLVVILTWNSITYTINAGEKAVIFRKFQGGLDKDKVYGQGFHVKWPWDAVYTYDVRKMESFSKMDVLDRNGLTITLDLSYRFYPKEDRIGYLHDEIGANYHDKIIKPYIRSAAREVIGKYNAEELYSTKREDIQNEIFTRTAEPMGENYLMLDAILIREVKLPPKLKEAIERKLEQEQASLEYEFKLQLARKEAERQRIEAEGKARANEIISNSLTEKILKEKGIDATLKLAESKNSKVIVVGSGKDGLPIILGNQ